MTLADFTSLYGSCPLHSLTLHPPFKSFPSFRDCVGNVDRGRKQLPMNTRGTKPFLDKITPSPGEIVVNIAYYYYYYH